MNSIPDIEWCPVNVPSEPASVTVTFQNERGEVYGTFTLKPYSIAKYPITVAQFQAFIDAPDGFHNEAWWDDLPDGYHKQGILASRGTDANQPRDSVSWIQAVAFGRWLSAHSPPLYEVERGSGGEVKTEIRLPTEWEWHYAACKSGDGRGYPFGERDLQRMNVRETRLGQTTAVGTYPNGASWCGAEDMSGNLWEWCLNAYHEPTDISTSAYRQRVLRGGSFVDVADWAVCGSRFNDLPNRRLDYYGFRVVRMDF